MSDFSSRRMDSDFGGSRRSPRRFNDRGSDRPEMHHAICDECGKDCEVPFKPSGDKPIYCSRCFETKGGGSRDRDDRGRGRDRDDRGRGRDDRGSRDRDRQMYSVVCDSCGKPDRVPFKPSSDKPIYCSECFETKGGKSTTNVQMTEINEKLDRILAKLEA